MKKRGELKKKIKEDVRQKKEKVKVEKKGIVAESNEGFKWTKEKVKKLAFILLGVIILGGAGIFFLGKFLSFFERSNFSEYSEEMTNCAQIEMSYLRDSCFSALAYEVGDSRICGKMSDKDARGYCEIVIDGDCSSFEEGAKRDSCFLQLGISSEQEKDCGKVVLRSKKDACYRRVAGANNNATVCGFISDAGEGSYCYFDVGAGLGNLSVCNMVSSENLKIECYGRAAVKNNNSNECILLDEAGEKDDCYKVVASLFGELKLCDRIFDNEVKGLREQCYFEVAEEREEIEGCLKILESSLRDRCFFNVAKATGNRSVCSNIGNSEISSSCSG